MSDDEILGMAYENLDVIARIEQPMIFEMSPAELLIFARAIESRTMTNQKAKWYQEGVEAGLRQALDQLPDTTKMIEPQTMTATELADRIKRGEKWTVAEPDTGTDRGAWDDVPDATKWVDELRGDEPEQEWIELTRGQIAQAVANTTNEIELGFAIEAICKENNGYT
jgi:hypothetical protein